MYSRSKGFVDLSSRDEIFHLLDGYTLKADGYLFYYASDGVAVGRVGNVFDTGTREVFEGAYCEQWQIWGRGEQRCWSVQVEGDRVKRTGMGAAFNAYDAPTNEFERLPGNHIYHG